MYIVKIVLIEVIGGLTPASPDRNAGGI